MAVSHACPNSRIWIRATLRILTLPNIRLVSTTSAIKRGLWKERLASKPRESRRPSRPDDAAQGHRESAKRISRAGTERLPRSSRTESLSKYAGRERPPPSSRAEASNKYVGRERRPEGHNSPKSLSQRAPPPDRVKASQDNSRSFIRQPFGTSSREKGFLRGRNLAPRDKNAEAVVGSYARAPARPQGREQPRTEQDFAAHGEASGLLRTSVSGSTKEQTPVAGNFRGLRRRFLQLQAAEKITSEPDLKEISTLVRSIQSGLEVAQNRGADQMRKYLGLESTIQDDPVCFLGTPVSPGWLWSPAAAKPASLARSLVWVQFNHNKVALELLASPNTHAALSQAESSSAPSNDALPTHESHERMFDPSDHAPVNEQKPARTSNNDAWTPADKLAAGLIRKQDQDNSAPTIPRTTAASTFLYGTNTVYAALTARRRKLYKIYFSSRKPTDSDEERIYKAANRIGIPINSTSRRQLLDAMSDNRPHNGVILEASQLPAPPLSALGRPDTNRGTIPLELTYQSLEDVAVNGKPEAFPFSNGSGSILRHPFVLMLDGILDPQNVGNIIRTAYFYGVSAIAVSTNTCCSLASAALAKASSGACEAIQIFMLPQPSSFVWASKKAGWKIYAAVAPADTFRVQFRAKKVSHVDVSVASPLANDPVILMLGAEGDGLRDNLKQRADVFVSIATRPKPPTTEGRARHVDVDSINVGTAAAVLIDSFLREPLTVEASTKSVVRPAVHEASAEEVDAQSDSVEAQAGNG